MRRGLFFLSVQDWQGSGFFWRPARPRRPARGATIAVRSLRSGLPLPHPRHRLRRFLRIPLGLSTPHAPGTAATPGSRCRKQDGRRGGWFAWRFFRGFGGSEDLAGPRCVGRAGGLAALTRCGSVSGARCARRASRGKPDLIAGWRYLAAVAGECSGLAAGGSGIRIPHIRNF
jgi:hypothetical protein